jgi:hypothetical protein
MEPPNGSELLWFFKQVNTDANVRLAFLQDPLATLDQYHIVIDPKHHGELKHLIKKYLASPPQGSLSIIYPNSPMYDMILLLNNGQPPKGQDDFLIT